MHPIFADEPNGIVVTTVSTCYFQWCYVKVTYDADVDTVSIRFRETAVTTRDLGDGIAAEFGAEHNTVGFNIPDAARHLGGIGALRRVTLEGVGLVAPA